MNGGTATTAFRERISPTARVLLEELSIYYPPRFTNGLPFTEAANRRRQDATFIDHLFDADLDLADSDMAKQRWEDPDWEPYSTRTDRRPQWVIDKVVAATYDQDRLAEVLADIHVMRSFTDDLGPVLRNDVRRKIDAHFEKHQRIDDLLWPPARLLFNASCIVFFTILAWFLLATFTIFPPYHYLVGVASLFAGIVAIISGVIYLYLGARRAAHREWFYSKESQQEDYPDDGSTAAA